MVFEKRYEAIRKRLGLKKVNKKGKKFLILQIDALSYHILKHYLARGGCRGIKRLIDEEGFKLQKWNCGIPSGTSAVQAGIMYGENQQIPGFRFLDKKGKKQFSFGNPYDAKYIEKKYFSGKKGILDGGSSYSNHFSGGAERSILTMSTIAKNKQFKRIRESSLWLFLLLHPVSLARVLYYTAAEVIIETISILFHPIMRLRGRRKAIFKFWIPIRRLLMNAIMAELITIGTIVDVKRGVPKIYTNYMNWDDIAHLRGPESAAAYLMARATDRRIQRIYERAKENYDVFVMSDHGMIQAVPFRELNGMTLPEFIERSGKVESTWLTSAFEGRNTLMGVTMKKTSGLVMTMSAPIRWLVRPFTEGLLKVLKRGRDNFTWNRGEKVIVSDSCSIANIYITSTATRMNLSTIERKHPGLVKKLIKNKGIGLVMAKQGDKMVLIGKGGRIIAGAGVKKEGKDILSRYGDEGLLLNQLLELHNYQHIGDLVLFGNYENGMGVSFTEHVGAHGGIGGNMCWPFMLCKKDIDLSKVRNARELHKIFAEYSKQG